jgi:ATP-binding cassette subfamily E protein 1
MRKRIAIVDRDKCRPDKCGNYLCIRVCPPNLSGEECIVEGPGKTAMIIEESCIGCGICVKKCPFGAIDIVNLPEQLEETPVHRFGKNQFMLFRLPFPVPGKIVGLIGSNGLGKTTALEILSGHLRPNLGRFDKKSDLSELITLFRGTELQEYLTRLNDRKMSVSYKIQRVDKIPSFYKGSVSSLLQGVDERGILNDLIQRFDIERILDHEVNEISGGELQRVSVAAALSKDADIYYLDEPTSFLDVFQRIEVSKVIKEFCADRSVIVVDHDLATMDFLADAVHIFYGSPGAYGVVSNPYSVRVGINAFLDGLIKEDNVRIRKDPVFFQTTFIENKSAEGVIIEFEGIEKKLGDFNLKVDGGEIHRQEVLGILGANALGKTTLAKIFAGELKADKGKTSGNVKISYKSQYPRADFDGTVAELLGSVTKRFGSSDYESSILRPLGLHKLLNNSVDNLSGGELQRVAIAVSLSQDSDLYLLDEPSAFLDVDQRLNLAVMIRRLVEKRESSALIIDHDLLFLSQISDRGMLFTGKPGIEGHAGKPVVLEESFNRFLKQVNITFRKDKSTGRPRANKPDSQMDREQKAKGNYFMS